MRMGIRVITLVSLIAIVLLSVAYVTSTRETRTPDHPAKGSSLLAADALRTELVKLEETAAETMASFVTLEQQYLALLERFPGSEDRSAIYTSLFIKFRAFDEDFWQRLKMYSEAALKLPARGPDRYYALIAQGNVRRHENPSPNKSERLQILRPYIEALEILRTNGGLSRGAGAALSLWTEPQRYSDKAQIAARERELKEYEHARRHMHMHMHAFMVMIMKPIEIMYGFPSEDLTEDLKILEVHDEIRALFN